jgi:hypothetical protein
LPFVILSRQGKLRNETMVTANDAVLPFPLRQALDRVDTQLDILIYNAFPLPKTG